jgi:hypothetical protein
VSGWLDPLRRLLDDRGEGKPVRFFFRDDDVGWADDRLWALLDRFDRVGLPVDLAVIPAALTPQLSRLLAHRLSASSGRLAVHQHGYTHDNHEPAGRKHEFGPSRTPQQQHGDIWRGRELLAEAFGPYVVPIFTPPWNRCTPATGRALLDLGVRVLSCDDTAPPLDLPGLAELPVRVDWFAHHKGVRHPRAALGTLLAETAAAGHPVGVMLHHELMADEELADLAELLELVAGHPAAVGSPMLELAGVPAATAE